MKITCNRIGGFNIHGVALRHGENEVDAQAWRRAVDRCIPAWLAAVTGGDQPDIVVHNGTGGQRVVVDRHPLSADFAIDRIESCDDIKEVEAMAEGELRADVLEAIDRRLETLLSQKET